jgi:acetyltransferase-like isoleucine patch superfamily enzyme
MNLPETSAPALQQTRRAGRFDAPRPVKEAVKATILKVKRIETDTGELPLPIIRPSVVRSGEGTVKVGRGSSVGRRCELQAYGGSISLGNRSSLAGDVRLITYSGSIRIGNDSVIVSYSLVYGGGGVTIGDHVLIGNHCVISGLDHTYSDRESVARSPMREAPVFIGDDVWIGSYCLVMAGVTIGEGAIVGAHSLVRDDVPPFAVVVGQPARVVRMR